MVGPDSVAVAVGMARVVGLVEGHAVGRADAGVRKPDGHGVGALGSRIVEPVVRASGGVGGRRGEELALGHGGVPWVDVGGGGTGYAPGLTWRQYCSESVWEREHSGVGSLAVVLVGGLGVVDRSRSLVEFGHW